jgi:hypothetical protein
LYPDPSPAERRFLPEPSPRPPCWLPFRFSLAMICSRWAKGAGSQLQKCYRCMQN